MIVDGDETTGPAEAATPDALVRAIQGFLAAAPSWESALERLERLNEDVEELFADVAEVDDDAEATRRLVPILRPVVPEVTVDLVATWSAGDVAGLVHQVTELLGEWVDMYIDMEKMVGHLVLVHGWTPPAGPVEVTHSALIRHHQEVHGA